MQVPGMLRFPICLALTHFLALGVLQSASAGSATWNLNPTSKFWNNPANWMPATVPDRATDIATFDVSNLTAITYSVSTEVGAFVFNPGASSYTFTVPPGSTTLTVAGAGVTNNSGNPQQFVLAQGKKGNSAGVLLFEGSATAGDATYTLNPGRFGEVPSFWLSLTHPRHLSPAPLATCPTAGF